MLEKYRVSLEVAKKLKDAGFPQDDCDAYWSCIDEDYKSLNFGCDGRPQAPGNNHYAAPCVGRLGDELPEDSHTRRANNKWFACLDVGSCSKCYADSYRSEADARALCWIELKERGIL